MVNDTTTIEYQLPGAYDYQARTSEKEDKVSLPLAIVSSVLFPSEVGIMLQTTHTSLPGAWIKDEQNNQIMTSLTTLSSSSSSSTQPHQQEEEGSQSQTEQKEQKELQQNQEHHKVEKQEKPTSTFNKVEYDNQVDALRQTVAELRKKAEQLEQADVMVKKGIEAVARKRVIAQHKRRRQSGWDWCDDSSISSSGNNSSSNEDDDGVTPSRRPNKKKPLIFVDDEGGEWEVI